MRPMQNSKTPEERELARKALDNNMLYVFDVDYIITRDTDDFKNCAVPAITPEQFLLIAHEYWEE